MKDVIKIKIEKPDIKITIFTDKTNYSFILVKENINFSKIHTI